MIRIGIVGCGRILAAHLRGYRLLREAGVTNFEITALCSRDSDRARSYVRRGEGPAQPAAVSCIAGDPLAVDDEYLSDFQPDTPVEIFTDFREMITSGHIDAVNDFSLHSLHHQVAEAAFAAGKHLLSQKPLAVTVEAARRMCEGAEKAGVTFGVFENLHFVPRVRHQHWAFSSSGPVGAMQMAAMGYLGVWWAPDLVVAETPWRHRLIEGGGITLDLAPHYFNMLREISGSEIARVSARTQVVEPTRWIRPEGTSPSAFDCDADDTFHAVATFESGATASLFASWAGSGGGTSVGEGGTFYGRHGKSSGNTLCLSDGTCQSLSAAYEKNATPSMREQHFPLDLKDDFALAQFDWLRSVELNRQPECSGEIGLRDLACAYAVLESSLARREVSIEEIVSGTLKEYQKPINEHFGLL